MLSPLMLIWFCVEYRSILFDLGSLIFSLEMERIKGKLHAACGDSFFFGSKKFRCGGFPSLRPRHPIKLNKELP